MSNMSKKKLIAMMALVIVIAILGTGTLAYFTTKAVVHNVITTGGVDIELEEKFEGAEPDDDGNMVLDGVMPGETSTKEVWVVNKDNSADAWIRVGVEITVIDSQGADLTAQAAANNVVTIPTYGTGWVLGEVEDGVRWYYYEDDLAPGEKTTNLFEKVSFSGPNMGNEYQNAEIHIDIKAQAVQTANNGSSVLEAAGWPKN